MIGRMSPRSCSHDIQAANPPEHTRPRVQPVASLSVSGTEQQKTGEEKRRDVGGAIEPGNVKRCPLHPEFADGTCPICDTLTEARRG